MKPVTLRTNRLILRRANSGDAEALYTNYLSSDERSTFLTRKPYQSISQAREFIHLWCDLPWECAQPTFAWVIATIIDNKPIGLFLTKQNAGHIEIHYGICKEHEGQGLISEAGLIAIEWLSSQPGVKKIYAHCDLDNFGSQAVLEKLGLKKMSILKSHLLLPAFGSKPRDCLLYELIIC